MPDDVPSAIVEQIDRIPLQAEVAVPAIGPVVERSGDPIPLVLRRVFRSYRQPMAASAHPELQAIVASIDGLRALLESDSTDALRPSLMALRDQTTGSARCSVVGPAFG